MSLSELLTLYRNEARISPNVAHGSHLDYHQIALLQRVQEQLYMEHEWPNLRVSVEVTAPPLQRYTAIPDTIDMDGIRNVFARPTSADDWVELTFGVRTEDYNALDSAAGETGDYTQRWRPHQDVAAEVPDFNQIETWPIVNEDVILRFEAKRALLPLVDAQTDNTTLDGPLIALFAAVETLAAQKAEDTPLKIQAARARLDALKMKATPGDNRKTSMLPGTGRHSVRHANGRHHRFAPRN